MKRIVLPLLLVAAVAALAMAWLSFTSSGKRFETLHLPHRAETKTKTKKLPDRLILKAGEAKIFAAKNHYNQDFCFLIDLSMPSGQKRFFIYDLKKDSLVTSGLVTHGNCNEYWLEGRKYNNKVGEGCSSLGKYKVGASYYGRFGLAYKLHGLDPTNDKAYERYVVLHSHECVPDEEVADEICQSNGCPTVSPDFLKVLEKKLKNAKKPVLLWIVG